MHLLCDMATATVMFGTSREWKRFAAASIVGIAGVTAVVGLLGFAFAGTAIAGAVDFGAQALAMIAAAATCGLLARRSARRLRKAWGLIGSASLLAFIGGALVFGYYGLIEHSPAPFPSAGDAVFLTAQVLTLFGVLSFPSSPTRTSGRARMAVDGLVIAVSMLYVGWALGLGSLYQGSHVQVLAATVGLAYPVTDMVTLTAVLLVLRRAPRTKHLRLGLLACGVGLKLIANAGLALSHAADSHVAGGTWPDVAFIAGMTFIGLAAVAPAGPSRQQVTQAPVTLWRMLMPWLGLVAVMATMLVLGIAGEPLDRFLLYPGVALVVLLMISQVESYRETLAFLRLSRKAEAALQARTQLLNQVIAHAPLGVARISLGDRFLDANPRLGELLRSPMKIILGAPLTEFIERDDPQAMAAKYRSLMQGEVDTVEEETRVRRSDGTEGWLHWMTTAVRGADARVEYFLSMVEDISARHDAEETAMANLAGLERLNKMKSEFVSMVSHEFRTALVGIQGFSELIRDDDLEVPDIKGLAGDINSEAERLNRMIGEMLDLDRMEAGKIRLALGPVDLNKLLRESMERTRLTTDKHSLVEDLDVALPLVTGDSDRLVQVVSNLLSNAVKYSPGGGEIRVSSRIDGDLVHVSVIDHGQGIPKEFIPKVFGRYERFESNYTAKVAGTGLGLAISRQIIELHGGRIWVESEAGKGSTFHFAIPIAAAATEPGRSAGPQLVVLPGAAA